MSFIIDEMVGERGVCPVGGKAQLLSLGIYPLGMIHLSTVGNRISVFGYIAILMQTLHSKRRFVSLILVTERLR